MKKRYTDEQVIRILREAESREMPIKDLCKRHNITEQTFYRWRNKFGGMDVSEARRLKELESENERLKRLVAEQLLVIDGLKEFSRKNEFPDGPTRSARCADPAGIITTQGMSLPGLESPGVGLYAQAAGKRPQPGRTVDCCVPGGASLWLSNKGVPAVLPLSRRARDVLRNRKSVSTHSSCAGGFAHSRAKNPTVSNGCSIKCRSKSARSIVTSSRAPAAVRTIECATSRY